MESCVNAILEEATTIEGRVNAILLVYRHLNFKAISLLLKN